jgi:cob(I)alamin adenosyltransferase
MTPSVTESWQRGCLQVYTGSGKGKTTAALGLALRALGAGLRVYWGSFCKGRPVSELQGLERFGGQITVRQFGRPGMIWGEPTAADIQAAREGLAEARQALQSGDYEVVILDEANVALHLGLLELAELQALIEARPPRVELVLTGRDAAPEIMACADLVTEMLELKHPYTTGLHARRGIEE